MSLLKGRVRFDSFSVAEMLVSMAILTVLVVASAPLITIRDKMQGQDYSSIMCIKNELAANPSENVSASSCASNATNPCCQAIKSCKYDQNNSCSTLQYYADKGVGNETINGKKALGSVCDQGGSEGCKYFVISCNQDNTTCSNSTNNYSLKYYLNLLPSSTNMGLKPVTDVVKTLVTEGSPTISYWLNNTCQCPTYSLACSIQGLTCSAATTPGWQLRFTDASSDNLSGYSIITDSSNNIYVAGGLYNGHDSDMFLVKMNSSGNMTSPYGFAKKINSSNKLDDDAESIVVDSAGNIYFSGRSVSSGSKKCATVMKMNSSGNMTAPNGWAIRFKDYTTTVPDYPTVAKQLGKDSQDNLYLASYTNDANPSILLIKLNSSGNFTSPYGYVKKFTSIYSGYQNFGYAVTTDSQDNVYLTGVSYPTGSLGIPIIKLNSSGNATAPYGWLKAIPGSNLIEAYSLTTDSSNNVYIVGGEYTGSPQYGVIIKMNSSGNMTSPYGWQYRMTDGNSSQFNDITVDSSGNSYVYAYLPNVNNHFAILKFDPNGSLSPNGWQLRLTSSDDQGDSPGGITIGSDGSIYITGASMNAGYVQGGLVMKMSTTQTGSSIFSDISSPYTTVVDNAYTVSNVTPTNVQVDSNNLFKNTTSYTFSVVDNPGFAFQ